MSKTESRPRWAITNWAISKTIPTDKKPRLAAGGVIILKPGQLVYVGERGPETVIPLV
jgi:hypothetical protein